MTKLELLKRYHDQECHNLLCYSANYGMTRPRAGMEAEHAECLQRVTLLEEMIRFEGAREGHVTIIEVYGTTPHVQEACAKLREKLLGEDGIPRTLQFDSL